MARNRPYLNNIGLDITNRKPKKTGEKNPDSPGFFRRLAAICYDSLLLLAVWFVATALILPFNSGKAFASGQFFYPLYLLIVSYLFFGWFWTHGGQTLGMRAWKIKVLTLNMNPVNWKQAAFRFLGALLSWFPVGLGYFWVIISKNNRAWHDMLSGTVLVFDHGGSLSARSSSNG